MVPFEMLSGCPFSSSDSCCCNEKTDEDAEEGLEKRGLCGMGMGRMPRQ